MNKKFKLLSILSLSFMSATLLSGCVTVKDPNNGGNNGGTDEPVSVELDSDYKCELSLLIPNGNANEEQMINELITEFNLDYPNITFKKNYLSVSNYENTVKNQWLANSLPDIVWSNSPDFYTLVAGEMCMPLNKYIEAEEEKGTFVFENDFLTEYFRMGAVDGKYYCFPRSCDSVVTFYNKKLLSQAGVDLSLIKNGWTWDTFMGVLETYRKYLDTTANASTYYCLDANLTTWLSVCYPMLKSFGANIIDSNKNVLINSAETKECLSLVKDMSNKKYIVADNTTPGSSFETGTAPFLFQSASVSLFAERRELKGNMDIVSFPLIMNHNTPKIGSGIAGYTINSKCKEKTAAWKFLAKMLSKEGQNAMARGGLNLPSIRKDLQDYASDDVAWGGKYKDLNLSAYTYGGEYKVSSDFLSLVDVKYKAKLDEAVRNMFAYATRFDKTVDDAVNSCEKALKNALK